MEGGAGGASGGRHGNFVTHGMYVGMLGGTSWCLFVCRKSVPYPHGQHFGAGSEDDSIQTIVYSNDSMQGQSPTVCDNNNRRKETRTKTKHALLFFFFLFVY